MHRPWFGGRLSGASAIASANARRIGQRSALDFDRPKNCRATVYLQNVAIAIRRLIAIDLKQVGNVPENAPVVGSAIAAKANYSRPRTVASNRRHHGFVSLMTAFGRSLMASDTGPWAPFEGVKDMSVTLNYPKPVDAQPVFDALAKSRQRNDAVAEDILGRSR